MRCEFVRKVDTGGRIVLPSEYREDLGIEDGKTNIGMYREDDKIIIRVVFAKCRICGSTNRVDEEFQICSKCIQKIIDSKVK